MYALKVKLLTHGCIYSSNFPGEGGGSKILKFPSPSLFFLICDNKRGGNYFKFVEEYIALLLTFLLYFIAFRMV